MLPGLFCHILKHYDDRYPPTVSTFNTNGSSCDQNWNNDEPIQQSTILSVKLLKKISYLSQKPQVHCQVHKNLTADPTLSEVYAVHTPIQSC